MDRKVKVHKDGQENTRKGLNSALYNQVQNMKVQEVSVPNVGKDAAGNAPTTEEKQPGSAGGRP